MSERNVPFLLNSTQAQGDTWVDRLLGIFSRYFRRRRFSEFQKSLHDSDSIIDFGELPRYGQASVDAM